MALDMRDGDWIPLWRKIRKNWVWKDPEDLRAWIDLLMMANYHDGMFPWRGMIYPIAKGQAAATMKSIADRNGWSRGRARNFIRRLCTDLSIKVEHWSYSQKSSTWTDTKSDRSFMLITIINHPLSGEVSNNGHQNGHQNGQQTDSKRTANGHIQEGKEGEERKEKREKRASASALPTPAVAPAPQKPIDRHSIIQRLISDVETMSPGAAQRSIEMDEKMYRGDHPYPEVLEAKKRKSAETGGKAS